MTTGLRIHMIVKGNRFQAARAAADRGIPFAFNWERKGESAGFAGEEHRDKIAAWYGDFSESIDSPGTLLCYSDA